MPDAEKRPSKLTRRRSLKIAGLSAGGVDVADAQRGELHDPRDRPAVGTDTAAPPDIDFSPLREW